MLGFQSGRLRPDLVFENSAQLQLLKILNLKHSLRNAQDPPDGGMETVVCGKCEQRFAIHNEGAHDPQLAEKQIAWLQDQLVWGHIQERKTSRKCGIDRTEVK